MIFLYIEDSSTVADHTSGYTLTVLPAQRANQETFVHATCLVGHKYLFPCVLW